MLETSEVNTYTLGAAKEASNDAFIAGINAAFATFSYTTDWQAFVSEPDTRIVATTSTPATDAAEAAAALAAQQPITYLGINGSMITTITPQYEGSAITAAGVVANSDSLGMNSGGQTVIFNLPNSELGALDTGQIWTGSTSALTPMALPSAEPKSATSKPVSMAA